MMKINKVKEIAELNRSNVSSKDDFEYINYLDTSSLTKNKISSIQFLYQEFPSRAKRKVHNKTILYSTVRPEQEHYGILENLQIENLIVSTGFTTIDVVSKEVDPKFLYYLLIQPSIIQYLQSIAENSVSAYPSIKPEEIGELKFRFPKLQNQLKIGKVLSDLDAKIELNNRINAELEAMAKLVYEYWFVQFDFPTVTLSGVEGYKSSGGKMVWNEELKREVPEGWRSGTISDIASLTRGVTYNKDDIKDEFTSGTIPILRATNITGNQIDLNNMVFVSESLADDEQILRPYDILITMSSGSIEHIGKNGFYFFDENVAFGAFCAKIQAIEDFRFYLYSYTQSDFFFTTIKNECLGTNINNLNGSMVKGFKLVIPDNLTLVKFNLIVQPLYEKTRVNTKQNQELSMLRDWLLPMLMNGQVGVKDEEEMVEGELGMVAERGREKYNVKQS